MRTLLETKCPNCNGTLWVPKNKNNNLYCMYCGMIVVGDGSDSNRNSIKTYYNFALNALDVNDFLNAYSYFSIILREDPSHLDAWIGKGFAAGMLATSNNLRFEEVEYCFSRIINSNYDGKGGFRVKNGYTEKLHQYYCSLGTHYDQILNVLYDSCLDNDLIKEIFKISYLCWNKGYELGRADNQIMTRLKYVIYSSVYLFINHFFRESSKSHNNHEREEFNSFVAELTCKEIIQRNDFQLLLNKSL